MARGHLVFIPNITHVTHMRNVRNEGYAYGYSALTWDF